MLKTLLSIDIQITQFLHSILPHNRFFNLLFSFFSQQGGSLIIWIVLIILALIFEERKHPGISKNDKQFLITIILTLALTGLLVNYGLKNVFQRMRPYLTDFNRLKLISTNFNCPSDFSFPSSHAAIAFSASAILAHFHKKRKYFYYSIAILISLSRIYLGCHYFFDVIIGGLIGYLIAKTMLLWLKSHSN